MFRLDNILEQWATLYKPISHSDTEKSFFRISMIDAQSYFIRNFAKQHSPCMGYVTHVNAEVSENNSKAISYRHVVYFLAKQQNAQGKTDLTDEDAATDARYKCSDMTEDLLAVLKQLKAIAGGKAIPAAVVAALPEDVVRWMQQTAQDAQYREGLRGLQLDKANWGTLPIHLNGWQVCALTIEQIAPCQACINEGRY